FRTIQVEAKDLPIFLRQVERAGDRPAAPTRQRKPDVRHEAPRVHHASRRRRGLAGRRARAAADDAACRLCRYAAPRIPTLCKFPQTDGRTRLSRRSELYIRLYPSIKY